MVHDKTLYEKLIYSPEEFSFVKAIDVAVASCDIKFIEIKSKINFTSKYTDVSVVEGLKDGVAEVYTNLNGVAGIEGILPDCYVEEFVTFNRDSKKAVADFFDIFNNRMLSLRYSYMKRQSIESLSTPICQSVIGNIIFSFSGFDFDRNREKLDSKLIPEQFKISTQNLFWKNTRSSSGLETMLSSFFDVPVRVEQFAGGFIEIEMNEQTSIGARKNKYNELGRNSILGNKIWDMTKGISVVVGPLNYQNYSKFLPKKSTRDQNFAPLQKMKEIVRMYVPHGIDVNLHFYLDNCLVKETTLNGINRLNKDAFIFGIHKIKTAYFCEKV